MIESPSSALSNALPHAQKNKIFARTATRNIAQTDTIPTAIIGLALSVHPLKKDPCGDKKNTLSDTRPSANNDHKTKSCTATKQKDHSSGSGRARYQLLASTTVDPTTHGTNRARATADRTTHDGKTKQTRPQRRPLKSQSRSKTVANRPRNRRSKHAQSPTLPPHATAAPNTK